MNRKKLLIAIIAIVLVLAVLLVIYFDYRSKHSLSLMNDEELGQYLKDNDVQLLLHSKELDISVVRKFIKLLEQDPDYPLHGTNLDPLFENLRKVVKAHYGISP